MSKQFENVEIDFSYKLCNFEVLSRLIANTHHGIGSAALLQRTESAPLRAPMNQTNKLGHSKTHARPRQLCKAACCNSKVPWSVMSSLARGLLRRTIALLHHPGLDSKAGCSAALSLLNFLPFLLRVIACCALLSGASWISENVITNET